MKYIIDVPSDLYAICKTLRVPVKVGNGDLSWYNTYIKAEPYTEPDRESIEDEVWGFVRIITDMTECERKECFGCSTCDLDEYMTYKDAKAKYEAWRKQKDKIRVGDEVIYNSRTKAIVLKPETKERYGTILTTSELATISVSHDDLEKTGRHFDEIEELMKKMRGAE